MGPIAHQSHPLYIIKGPIAQQSYPQYRIMGPLAQQSYSLYRIKGPIVHQSYPQYRIMDPIAHQSCPQYRIMGSIAHNSSSIQIFNIQIYSFNSTILKRNTFYISKIVNQITSCNLYSNIILIYKTIFF